MYHHRDGLAGGGGRDGDRQYLSQQQQRQFPLLQPQFKQVPRSVPPRDRYRAPRREETFDKDSVEDDVFGDDLVFDAFDQQILRQSAATRTQRAENREARLLLAPPPMVANRIHGRESEYYGGDDHDDKQKKPRPSLSQFTYSRTQSHDSSSDVPLGSSSSPAFRAALRHTDVDSTGNILLNGYSQEQPHSRYQASMRVLNSPNTPTTSYQQADEEEPYAASSMAQEQPYSRQQVSVPIPKGPIIHSRPLTVQGIEILPLTVLPDRLRKIFPYPNLNAVQSKCFDQLYQSDDNFVLASPTGSGKTVILELAICRAITMNGTGQFKIVYQAPMKALCSERQRDWHNKFDPLGIKCVELTGDTDAAELKNVQTADIIITTPEKWDSVTRKWKDHEGLMRLVKLFLIDEVHILKEDRGAILEAVVSRMKSIGTDVRFVALSATVPNFNDVATWLGRSSKAQHLPALNEKFGEEFRPVKLQKHVCGFPSNGNEYVYDKALDSHLPGVISKYSQRKPILVFCVTRKSAEVTARMLAQWWSSRNPKERLWNAPVTAPTFRDRTMRECAAAGVAFHHAGVDSNARLAVEKAFLNNEIGVICCTSTLAVGVNLPCHMVIVKNTVKYGAGAIVQEYSDLEVMQILGRAGRPQFENSAVAVIMTRPSKVDRYKKMVTGTEVLESTLHLNLVDHLNAEIGLGTIRDFQSARKWFAGTFLHVRLRQNPGYYKLGGTKTGKSAGELLDQICHRDISLLRENNLAEGEEHFRCTEFGHIMARYYVHFRSMQMFMTLQSKASISEILSAIAQAAEFETIRFRQGEKSLYKEINKSPCTRFSIPVDLALPAHKVSLLIQSVLGAMDISWDGDKQKHKTQYNTEANVVFRALPRLIRCIIDCQITLGDSVSINNALVLERSTEARVWDDGPSQLKQIDGIGVVGIRKLVTAGIRSIEELECVEPNRIDYLLGRQPPFGTSILEHVKSFPKLRISLSMNTKSVTKTPEGVKVMIRTDVGFINEKVPITFRKKAVYICIMAETSDGRMAHFDRASARQLGKGQKQELPVILRSPGLSINCYIMCEGIAGTQRSASITPKIATTLFSPPKYNEQSSVRQSVFNTRNMSKRRSESGKITRKVSTGDEFDDGVDDEDLANIAIDDSDFDHIDNYPNSTDNLTRSNIVQNSSSKENKCIMLTDKSHSDEEQEPHQLENGNWACNHACKNKQACAHYCCKHGMKKPPKKTPAKPKRVTSSEIRRQATFLAMEKPRSTQTKLQLTASKRKGSVAVEELDLTQPPKKKKDDMARSGTKEDRDLHRLHQRTRQHQLPTSVSSVMHTKPQYCYGKGGDHDLSFLDKHPPSTSTDYGDTRMNEVFDSLGSPFQDRATSVHRSGYGDGAFPQMNPLALDQLPGTFGDDDSAFGDAMIEMSTEDDLTAANHNMSVFDDDPEEYHDRTPYDDFGKILEDDYDIGFKDDELFDLEEASADPFGVRDGTALDANNALTAPFGMHPSSSRHAGSHTIAPPSHPKKNFTVFLDETSRPKPSQNSINLDKVVPATALKELGNTNTHLYTPVRRVSNEKLAVNKGKNREVEMDIEFEQMLADDVLDDVLGDFDMADVKGQNENEGSEVKEEAPGSWKELEPWLFEEFGDCVEIVDG